MDNHQIFWLARARREALRFNLGWWVQFFLPWVFGLGIVGSVSVLGLRSFNRDLMGVCVAALLVVLAGVVISYFLARKRFLSTAESLARLDADLGLHTRLSSANQGVGDWPAPHPRARLALSWNWTRLLAGPLVAMALVVAAVFIPLPKGQSKPAGPAAAPPSWDAIQTRLDALQQSDIVQAEALEEYRKSLDALRNQPPDQWFGHESLEATDQLREQVDQSAGKLGEQLETALSAMEAARSADALQSQALGDSLDKALDQTIHAIERGALPLNEKTLAQLKGLDASRARQVSPEQWNSLTDKLKAGVATSPSDYPGRGETRKAALAAIADQGGGGPERGPGTAPLMLKADQTQLGTTQTETVQNDDLSHAALGDLAGLAASEPQADGTAWRSGQSGGANSSTGTGGETVWDQVATPAEQEALRRFFQ
jgi:hypothetical protein